MLYRSLTTAEIQQLVQNGCESTNWNQITVKEGFTVNQIHRVRFSGDVQLGILQSEVSILEGIRDAAIHDCTIEDHVRIEKVDYLANYIVRSHACIEYCQTITTDDRSNFGNGSEVEPINEAGGREVIIFEGLTAQVAWMMAFLRHKPSFIKKLKQLIVEQIINTQSEKGIIGHRAKVSKCRTLKNTKIGDDAILDGVSHLNNGTVLSSQEASTYIGHDVKAYDFIIGKGSKIDNGSILKKCFVGEGCIIDRQFSAENTVVFANSQLIHGEACSVFAAPYTVSHHKSTLLIAGYFSFINVGSGSNQSNHMYKLGPVHQGVLERGCKLGSDSYLLWPAKIGPYTFVMGRHYSNPDISNFPYSYLLDDTGTSQLVPGANLRSSGTIRDAAKWPLRDIRQGTKSDIIHFGLFDPSVIGKVLKGKAQLEDLEKQAKPDALQYSLGDVRIKKPALKRGIEIYNEVMLVYMGNLLIEKVEKEKITDAELMATIQSKTNPISDDWIDVAGMICSKDALIELMEKIDNGAINNLSHLMKTLHEIGNRYQESQWNWALQKSESLTGIDLTKSGKNELITLLENYKTQLNRFYTMLIKDAQKEFSERSKTGFGFDNDSLTQKEDFVQVRGTYEENSFVISMKTDLSCKLESAATLISRLQKR